MTQSRSAGLGFAAGVLAALVCQRVSRRHNSGLSISVARQLQRHRENGLHLFQAIDARTAALVVIDMQEVFLSQNFSDRPSYCPGGRACVAAINRAAAALRQKGGRVIWIVSDVGPDSLESWSVLYGEIFPVAGGLRQKIRHSLTNCEGRWGDEYDPKRCEHGMDGPLDAALDVRKEDMVIKKDRFSPFAPGGRHQGCTAADAASGPMDFAERLRHCGIDTLLLAGVSTATCVQSTAQDAVQRNFRVVLLSDACAAGQWQHHTEALDNLAHIAGDVRTVASALSVLKSSL